jgi:hypothetical protein
MLYSLATLPLLLQHTFNYEDRRLLNLHNVKFLRSFRVGTNAIQWLVDTDNPQTSQEIFVPFKKLRS